MSDEAKRPSELSARTGSAGIVHRAWLVTYGTQRKLFRRMGDAVRHAELAVRGSDEIVSMQGLFVARPRRRRKGQSLNSVMNAEQAAESQSSRP